MEKLSSEFDTIKINVDDKNEDLVFDQILIQLNLYHPTLGEIQPEINYYK